MLRKREYGQVQPGIKWGPFVARVPFIHLKLSLPDLLQGFAIAGATGLALVPLMTGYLGLSFEEAVTMAMFHSMLICSAFLLFGDPYAPGWLTPAIPFVLNFVLAATGADDPDVYRVRFQAMTALALDFSLILIVLGLTGVGGKLIRLIPDVFKASIILGAAVAAFLRVTKPGDSANVFESAVAPENAQLWELVNWAGVVGVLICLVFAFSNPVRAAAANRKWLAFLIGLGLLPGFVVAGVLGYFTGDFQYNIRWEILDVGTHAAALWEKASPFSIGWPDASMMIDALPLAFITYILFFGDLVTGDEMNAQAQTERPDEKLEDNHNRAHISVGIRNALMGIFAPFFGTQGVLWTGIQVVLLKRWTSAGREKLDSFFDAMGSFYVFGLPILYVLLPLVTLLQPLLPLALAVTLILTGFACAILALSLVKDPTERGAMVLTAMAFGIFSKPWIGLLVGLVVILMLLGPKAFVPVRAHEEGLAEGLSEATEKA